MPQHHIQLKELDEWRLFFKSSEANIFDVIDNAILVAARDHPDEFKNRRGLITEKVYSCEWTLHCSQCHNELDIIEQARSDNSNDECENGGAKSMLNGNAGDSKAGCSKDCDVDRSRDDHKEFNHVSKYSYSEAEALTAEIDEKNEVIGEVLRIKNVLHNRQYASEAILFECLRRLQLMYLSLEILQATEIGKTVKPFQRHKSENINLIARELLTAWRITVNDWADVTAAIAGSVRSVESDPSPADEEGLPFPPLDEGALYATQTPMELSRFFDGIDDDGNLENSTEIDKNHESERIPLPENHNNSEQQSQLTKEENKLIKDNKSQQIKQGSITKFTETKPSNTETGKEIPQKESFVRKINNGTGFKEKSDRITIHKRPLTDQHAKTKLLADAMVQEKVETRKNKLPKGDKQVSNAKKQKSIQFIDDLPEPIRKLANPMRTNPSNIESSHGRPYKQNLQQKINNESSSQKCPSEITMQKRPLTEQQAKSLDEAAVEEKLEASKRKLKEKYKEVEKAKKERTTQFMELHELPKREPYRKIPHFKSRKHNWHWGKGRQRFS